MEKNNFVLYKNWKPLIDKLSDVQSGQLFKAIYSYVCGNGEDETLQAITNSLDSTTQMVFTFIQNALHDDLLKYRKACERNKNNVDKRWNKNTTDKSRIESYTKNTSGKSGIKSYTKNTTGNDIDIDIDNDIDIEDKKKNIKKKYGECNNVKLTDDEYKKLQELYKDKLNEAIDLLDNAIQIHGYKYKDHYRVMLGWVKKEILDKKTSDVKKDIEVVYDSSINKPMSDEELKALEEFRRV